MIQSISNADIVATGKSQVSPVVDEMVPGKFLLKFLTRPIG
jgi:hypothetical protein